VSQRGLPVKEAGSIRGGGGGGQEQELNRIAIQLSDPGQIAQIRGGKKEKRKEKSVQLPKTA
jgi:hypothetical protein